MKTKMISLAVLSLGVCTIVMAGEYMAPDVDFRQTAPSHRVTKAAEFNEDYKVEGAVKTDRQIASEKEPTDREPSSVVATDKKVEADKEVMDEKPQPWMFKNKLDK